MPSTMSLKRINTLSKKYDYIHCNYRIKRDFKEGETAPSAHQNTRVFPDWYKPYLLNYNSEGYFAVLLFGVFGLCKTFLSLQHYSRLFLPQRHQRAKGQKDKKSIRKE